MKHLDRKLLRDLLGMGGQALAIALVIVSGVATYVLLSSTLEALYRTREAFYRDRRFADVFSSLKRAPESEAAFLREIPGVDLLESRVVAEARLAVPGFEEPVTGRIVSLPDRGEPLLNRLYLRAGRLPDPARPAEVVVVESFALAHGLSPGDSLDAVIRGRKKTLRVAGIGLSPEYVYVIGPGATFPDFKRYGVLWMARTPLEAAADLEGAFNDVALLLSPGAEPEEVIARLDDRLARYGGGGAYGREDQSSHRYLSEEFRQLSHTASFLPAVFLAVAAFLLHIVSGRTVALQREQIATLKAFGYGNRSVAFHYLKLVGGIVLAGVGGGLLVGARLGRGLAGIYTEFYRFPWLDFSLSPRVAGTASLVTLAAAAIGTLSAVRRAATLPPAEGMRPEPPPRYRRTGIERLGIGRLLSQPGRMIVRRFAHRPVTSLLSVAGIALGCAIMVTGRFSKDAIDFLVEVQLGIAQREDMMVSFTEPASRGSLFELAAIPGVTHAEPYRAVPVRLGAGHRRVRTAIQGLPSGGTLQRVLDRNLAPVEIPPEGILLTDYLGEMLRVRPGDRVTAEILEGARPVREIPVAGLARQFLGIPAFMEMRSLSRLLGEGGALSGALLSVEEDRRRQVREELERRPRVTGIVERRNAIRNFFETSARMLLFFTFVATLFAGSIAFGVVYNCARISLSERSREMASLRVLGYTRGEISYILLGELFLLTVAAILPGFAAGYGLSALLAVSLRSDLFRVPVVVSPATYGLAAAVVLVSAILSGAVVRRQLDRLDLTAVLKTRE